MATRSKPVGWCSWLMSEKRSAIAAPFARRFIEQPFQELHRMAAGAVCGRRENRADSERAHRPLLENRRKVVLRGARKHVVTVHQRKSSLMMATPRGLHLGSVKFCVRLAAQASECDSGDASRTRLRMIPSAGTTVATRQIIILHADQIVAPLSVAAHVGVEGCLASPARQMQFLRISDTTEPSQRPSRSVANGGTFRNDSTPRLNTRAATIRRARTIGS